MSVDSFITIILFILPGYLVFKWNELLSVSVTNLRKTSLEKTAEIIMFAIPTVLISLLLISSFSIDSYLVFKPFYKLKGISDLEAAANSFNFLSWYIIIIILISFIVSMVWVRFIREKLFVVINRHRSENNYSHIESTSTWEYSLNLGNKRIANIYKLCEDPSQGEWGILHAGSKPIESIREVIIIGEEAVMKIPKEKLEHDYTYVNSNSQTVFKVYKYIQ